jgi:hypothetical protein
MQRKSYLSFGGGVQSTAIAELIFDGALPRPDAVVYADTGNEPDAVNAWVDLYETKFASAGIPFVRAKRGGKHASLGASIVAKALDGKGGVDIPFWVPAPGGKRGMPVRRGCTIEWKIKPINSAVKKLFGRKTPVEIWLGISTDESQRMKRGVDDSAKYFHPLIEKLHMSRAQCILYLTRKGISAPRSACIFCPFRNAHDWQELTASERGKVIEFDATIEAGYQAHGKYGGLRDRPYLRPDLRQFMTLEDFDKPDTGQLDLWDNECSGICGV